MKNWSTLSLNVLKAKMINVESVDEWICNLKNWLKNIFSIVIPIDLVEVPNDVNI